MGCGNSNQCCRGGGSPAPSFHLLPSAPHCDGQTTPQEQEPGTFKSSNQVRICPALALRLTSLPLCAPLPIAAAVLMNPRGRRTPKLLLSHSSRAVGGAGLSWRQQQQWHQVGSSSRITALCVIYEYPQKEGSQ